MSGMRINRGRFFERFRQHYGALTQQQVTGLEFILGAWEEAYSQRTPPTQLAYVLATAKWETAHTFQPIKEYGNRDRFIVLYDIGGSNPARARKMGNIYAGDGPKFCGRGYVQLTWHRNYKLATEKLQAAKIIGPSIDFTVNPELVMVPKYAVHILFEGMEGGWFTGLSLDKKIDGFINNDELADFKDGRTIINGTDKAAEIAAIAVKILDCIVYALEIVTPKPPIPVIDAQPPIPPPAPRPQPIEPPPLVIAAKRSWWQRFLDGFRSA